MDIWPLGLEGGEERKRRRRNERIRTQEGILKAPMNNAFVQTERYQAQAKDDTSEAAMNSKENTSRPPFKETCFFMLQVEYCGGP